MPQIAYWFTASGAMVESLVQQFLNEEVTTYVRALLHRALKQASTRQRLEFNRFEVTVDHDTATVLIEDVLDGSNVGSQKLTIEEFVTYLEATAR